MIVRRPVMTALCLTPICAALWAPLSQAAAADGEAIYRQRCSLCHENPVERTPPRAVLRRMPPETILAALKSGSMQPQASGLSDAELRNVAAFLSARPFGELQAAIPQANPCKDQPAPLTLAEPKWNGWGRDAENSRFQPQPGIAAADVPRLEVKWAYGYHGRSAYGQPSIVGGRLFVTSATGRVAALDAKSGCERWIYEAGGGVKSAVTVGELAGAGPARFAAWFGDEKGYAHAVDAQSGKPLWKTQVEAHPIARITGSVTLHQGRLYVPVSSHEEAFAVDPRYECCTFRGSVVALDAASGKMLWKSHTIKEEPRPASKNAAGTQMFQPAGAAIWSAPTIDAKRGVLYVGTGNSYTDGDTDGADAVIAFDLLSGERRWLNQVTPNDNFIVGCTPESSSAGNCPQDLGPDFDLGAAPILKTLPDGRQVLLAGQKSGVLYALDPDAGGKLLWQVQVGRGSPLGGIQWGPGSDARNVYVAISDLAASDNPMPGLTAIDIATGRKIWHTPTPKADCAWGPARCQRAQSAAVTVIPGIVFSGAMDGHIRAYSTKDGSIVWDFDTGKALHTINGLELEGGSIDAGGATVAGGVLYVNSGYGNWGKMGRLLIAFTVDGK